MHDTRLIKILRTLDADEFKNFGKFLNSPYFSTGRDLTSLYKELKKFFPAFSGNGLEKEKIFSRLGKGKYNEQLMRIMISDMYRMAVEYLRILAVNESPVKSKIHLSDEAIKRGLFFLAEQSINDAEELVTKGGIDADYFYNRFEIENQKTDHNFFSGETVFKGNMEMKASECSLFHFLMLTANNLHNFYSTKSNVNTEYSDYIIMHMLNNSSLDKLEPLLTGSKDKDIARIYLYYILSHIDSNDEQYFYKLKALLFKNLHNMVFSERSFLLSLYDSLCTKKIFDINFDKYTAERLEVKKKMLAEGMFRGVNANFISPVRFYSFIITGISAGDVKWVEMMLGKHLTDIAPEHRVSLYNYFKAEICYLKKDYETALQHTSKVDLTAFFIKPTLFALQLKIYFELNYVDEALSIIDTFRHYIAKNKQSTGIVKKARADFLSIYNKLIMYKNGRRANTIDKLNSMITRSDALHKKWLLQKLNELNAV